MVALSATQERNLRAALAVTDNEAERLRLAFAVWTESRGLNYANNGLNTSKSPSVTPAVAATLRRSLDIPHDAVGSNGRSTGILQQISSDVGGVWGSMAGTMDPATSARRFLAALRVTNNPLYVGNLLVEVGGQGLARKVTVTLSDPIAADVLRVQQPLASEALSSNYNAAQVAIAREIVAQLPTPTPEPIDEGWLDMAVTKEEVREAFTQANEAVVAQLRGANEQLDALNQRLQALVNFQSGIVEQQNAMNQRLDQLVKNTEPPVVTVK